MDIEVMDVRKVAIDKPYQLPTGSYTTRLFVTNTEWVEGAAREVTFKVVLYSKEPIEIKDIPNERV